MISVLLIGLGNIGQGYDYHYHHHEKILTHAQAISENENFQLIGAIEPNENLRILFQKKFKLNAHPNLEMLGSSISPDLVVIATPTNTHAEILNKVINQYRPSAILCEKPLMYKPEEAENLVNKCESFGVKLYVNYIRRTDRAISELKSLIDAGELKTPFTGICWYSKGLYNSATHFLDLFQYLFSDIQSLNFRYSTKERKVIPDVNIDFSAKYICGDVEFKTIPSERIFYNSFELIFQDARIFYRENGDIEIYSIENRKYWDDRVFISAKNKLIKSDMENYQKHVYSELFHAINGRNSKVTSASENLGILKLLANFSIQASF